MAGELRLFLHIDSDSARDGDIGRYAKPFRAHTVHFDGFSGNGLQLVTKTPVIGDDGEALTFSYTDLSWIGDMFLGLACQDAWWQPGPLASRTPRMPRTG